MHNQQRCIGIKKQPSSNSQIEKREKRLLLRVLRATRSILEASRKGWICSRFFSLSSNRIFCFQVGIMVGKILFYPCKHHLIPWFFLCVAWINTNSRWSLFRKEMAVSIAIRSFWSKFVRNAIRLIFSGNIFNPKEIAITGALQASSTSAVTLPIRFSSFWNLLAGTHHHQRGWLFFAIRQNLFFGRSFPKLKTEFHLGYFARFDPPVDEICKIFNIGTVRFDNLRSISVSARL